MPPSPPSSIPPVQPGTASFVPPPAPDPAHQSAPAAPQPRSLPAQHLPALNRPPAWLATGQPPAAPGRGPLRKHRLSAPPPVTTRTHADLQRAAQVQEAAREVIDAVLEPLGLQGAALSREVLADASVPDGLTAEQTEPALLRAVFLRLEVPRQMEWLAKLPPQDDVLDPDRFAPAALQARLGGGDLSTETPEANAAYAVNALLGEARVQPAAFTAPPPGQALEPEAVAAVLHAQGVATHLFRHTVLGHPAGPAPLDPKQVDLLDRLPTNRLLLQVRVGAACHHVVFLRVAGQWLRLGYGRPPRHDGLSPSAFLRQLEEAAGVHGFTALWPKHGLTADAPQPAAASAGQPTLHYDEAILKKRPKSKERQEELRHFGFTASWRSLKDISNACGPTWGKPAVDDQGQPVAGVYVSSNVQYSHRILPEVYRGIDENNVLWDLRLLVPPGDTDAYSNNRAQILKGMQSTRTRQKSRHAAAIHARTEIPPRHCFSTRSRTNFAGKHHEEFEAAGYEAQSFVPDIVVGQCESGEVLQVWKDGMLAVAIATPKGRATVLWQLENGDTTGIWFVLPGQTPEEKRKDLLKHVHPKHTAAGLKARDLQQQSLIEPLTSSPAYSILQRRRDAFASMLGCKPEEVTPATVRRVWTYCQTAGVGQYVPSAKPHIGMLTHFTIPPDISRLERESHVLCRRNENGKVTDLLPFEANALAAAQLAIENSAHRPAKRLREAEETDDEDYEDYYEKDLADAETGIPPSALSRWAMPGRTDPLQEEHGSLPAGWNP